MAPDDLAARLLVIFAEELDEQIQQLNDALLALERAPDDATHLQSVFRVMHTLKGAARAAGLQEVEQLCHTLENDLSHARDEKTRLTGSQMARLFESADTLSAVRDKLRGSQTPSAVEIAVPAVMERTEEHRAQGTVRVSHLQVESMAGVAGEISSFVSQLEDRVRDIAALRAGARGGERDGSLERELTTLLRSVTAMSRGIATVSGRLNAATRSMRQRPLAELTENLPRVVRDVALETGKQARIEMAGGEIEADRAVLEALRDPILHLVRNAVDHGLESPGARATAGKPAEGVIRVTGSLRGDRLRVEVSDDGAGIDVAAIRARLARAGRTVPDDDDEVAATIFDDGFSTRDVATTVSGRGVGLGIVRAAAERLGGSVDISYAKGRGTAISLDVPVSVATMNVLLVAVNNFTLGIPTSAVGRVLHVKREALSQVDGNVVVLQGAAPVRVVSLATILGPPYREAALGDAVHLVIAEHGGKRVALAVDDIVDERELVLRPVENAGASENSLTVGVTILGSGDIALVLNPAALAGTNVKHDDNSSLVRDVRKAKAAPARILVVDDSITSRTLEQSVLAAAGYDVVTAVDGAEAWRLLERQSVALVVSDVEMPHVTGIELCVRMRASDKNARTPIILVTSLDKPEERARGLDAGADAYLTKSSFDQNTLLDTIRMLIGTAAVTS